jgi:hypothetical protein
LSLRVYVIDCQDRPLLHADLQTVDALARLQLAALRVGARIRVLHPHNQLTELLALAGLDCVCGVPPLDVEVRRQPKEREEARGIQEERDAAEPIP